MMPFFNDAINRRSALFTQKETDCFRLFNGFYEGDPDFCVDTYAGTAVILWLNRHTAPSSEFIASCSEALLNDTPTQAILLKNRYSSEINQKNGKLLYGTGTAHECHEFGVAYPLRLTLNKDCGFYLDTANLRKWLLENSNGKRVLNCFAYTGSLGLAAQAGGAAEVTQTDSNRNYLPEYPGQKILYGDFFRTAGSLRHAEKLYDIIILDPPFFSKSSGGKVDQEHASLSLLNKIRPLAADGGKIILINNALYLSGQEFASQIQSLCGEYLRWSEIIPVPGSFYGWETSGGKLPQDPAPFDHPTKIVVLDVSRKDGKR